MNSRIAKTFRRIGDFFRGQSRKDYEEALTRVVTAVDSGKLKSTDKAPAATRFIDVGVFGPLDGVDWAELHALAEENRMPLATVGEKSTWKEARIVAVVSQSRVLSETKVTSYWALSGRSCEIRLAWLRYFRGKP